MKLEVFNERNIGKLLCFWEAIHAFGDFDKNSVVHKEMFNMMFINEILGGNPSWLPYVFLLIHSSVEAKVLDIQA